MSGAKVRLTIDGRVVTADPAASVLRAACEHGIEIPHFCYHPGLGIDGNCRLCLVEIEGMPKLQTSCTVPVKEGMVVFTDNDAVRKARKGVLEFFLLNHPLDCPFCDKGGECPLQNFTIDSGQFTSRLSFEKLHKAKHEVIGEHIVLDKERCVLCNRCVRFLRDLTGREELGIRNRGARSEIFVPEGRQLTSGFTGNLADLCPVGALTTRSFRFKARPWEMKTVDTICGECSLGCNVQAWKKGTDLLRLTPRIAPEVNEWWLCDRGRFGIHRIPDGERLRTPVKTGAPTELSTPEEIARGLAEGIRHLPKQSFAVVVNSPLVNEEFYVLKELAKAAGGGRLFVPIRRETRDLCGVIRKSGLEAGSLSSLERADSILVVGGNVEEDHPVLALRLRRLVRERGIPVHFVGGGDPSEFFPALHSLAGQRVHLLLSDRVVTRERSEAIRKGIDLLSRQKEKRVDISMLLTGEGNIRGVIDQWDETVFPMSELETEIQRGKIEGLYWFGPALSFPDFNEYVRGMRFFAQVVPSAKDAHPSAKRVLPADLFTEKRGTATENFGRVQLVRSARRVVERGFAPLDFVGSILSQLGGEIPSDVTRLYAEMASALPGYPPDLAAIPDAARTYRFYERALWR